VAPGKGLRTKLERAGKGGYWGGWCRGTQGLARGSSSVYSRCVSGRLLSVSSKMSQEGGNCVVLIWKSSEKHGDDGIIIKSKCAVKRDARRGFDCDFDRWRCNHAEVGCFSFCNCGVRLAVKSKVGFVYKSSRRSLDGFHRESYRLSIPYSKQCCSRLDHQRRVVRKKRLAAGSSIRRLSESSHRVASMGGGNWSYEGNMVGSSKDSKKMKGSLQGRQESHEKMRSPKEQRQRRTSRSSILGDDVLSDKSKLDEEEDGTIRKVIGEADDAEEDGTDILEMGNKDAYKTGCERMSHQRASQKHFAEMGDDSTAHAGGRQLFAEHVLQLLQSFGVQKLGFAQLVPLKP
ncbi:hypothetical protein L7F22_059305, partial [Adiantum nelumboides]|nr:hypothetical protein [Adiantum nelumboides]